MNHNTIKGSESGTILESARRVRLEKQRQKQAQTRDRLAEFMSANVQDSELGIIPEGYGGVTYLLLFIFLPWLIGTLFMFFYIGGEDIVTFTSLNSNPLLNWVMGYEILAALTLLYIFKKAVTYVFS